MTERSGYAAGMPSWVDIGADIDETKRFYGSLFGWVPEDAGPPEQTGGYGFFTKGGKQVAGYGPKQSPGPPSWAVYIDVTNADEAAKKVEEAGGRVVAAPMDVMTAGRMVVLQDPSGAIFSVWQAGDHKGAQLAAEVGALCWVELNTRDVDAAKGFYPKVFGWKPETHEGPMPYTEFKLGPESVAGMMSMPEQVPAGVPSHWLAYFGVEDVDASQSRAQQLGATVAMEPMDIPGGGRFSVLLDSQGAVFGLFRGG